MFGNGSKDEDNARAAAGKNFQTLREANVVRQAEWDPTGQAKDLFWRVNELAGETGELCNVLKKLHRERLGVPGSRATHDQLAEEAADVMICIDLLAIDCNISARDIQRIAHGMDADDLNLTRTLVQRGVTLTRCLGRVADLIEDGGLNVDEMTIRLAALYANVLAVGFVEKIDMAVAVANKFNATTHKVGLTTFLRYERG